MRFTRAEAEWFVTNLVRQKEILDRGAENDPKLRERRTYAVISGLQDTAKGLQDSLSRDQGDQFDVILDKKQKKTLRELLMGTYLAVKGQKVEVDEGRAERLAHMFRKFR